MSICTKEATLNTDGIKLKKELQNHASKWIQSSSSNDELQIKCDTVYKNPKQGTSFVLIFPSYFSIITFTLNDHVTSKVANILKSDNTCLGKWKAK